MLASMIRSLVSSLAYKATKLMRSMINFVVPTRTGHFLTSSDNQKSPFVLSWCCKGHFSRLLSTSQSLHEVHQGLISAIPCMQPATAALTVCDSPSCQHALLLHPLQQKPTQRQKPFFSQFIQCTTQDML